MKQRRRFLALAALALTPAARAVSYPSIASPVPFAFPRDHGAHPAFRTEWWYLTGWLSDGEHEMGFQVTFFRNRPGIGEGDASAFAPSQLLFAHAALADPDAGRLVHDQRAAREGFGLALAREGDLAVGIGDWSLMHEHGRLAATVVARDWTLALTADAPQPVLLQGDRGYSRKGPLPAQASFYYSWPQLQVSGTLVRRGARRQVKGVAWLDHEWSSQSLAPQAQGWDWTGINLDDGSALMAFRIRAKEGGVVWAGGSRRSADGRVRVFSPAEVRFEPRYQWRSPRTGVAYPVSMRVFAGGETWTLEPLLDDQELDASASTGTVYWEGAVRANGGEGAARANVGVVGRGYLELTGYGRPLRLG